MDPNPVPLNSTAEVSWTIDPTSNQAIQRFTPAILFVIDKPGNTIFQWDPIEIFNKYPFICRDESKFFVAENVLDFKGLSAFGPDLIATIKCGDCLKITRERRKPVYGILNFNFSGCN